MNHAFKSIFVTLMLTGALNSSFCQVTHTIELRLKRGTSKLKDPRTTDVNRGDIVIWQIKPGQNILNIKIEGIDHLFKTTFPPSAQPVIQGTIVDHPPKGKWKYTISYTLSSGEVKSKDPKIAIDPKDTGKKTGS
jgi:hypothetical protein